MRRFAFAALLSMTVLAAGCASDCCTDCCADETGFVSLFNGKDLSGWTGGAEGYEVTPDGLLMSKKGGKGNLLTEKQYGDFDLRLEFNLTPAANNGVGIRVPTGAKAASFDGMEIQIIDDEGYKATGKPLKDWQHCGSIYGAAAAKPGHVKKPGEWNTMRIVAQGGRVQVYLNDELVTDANVWQIESPISGKQQPGLKVKSGHLGFLGHNDVVYFRNIRVKAL